MRKIKKAIITAAGYGTRFLPATKSVQKEMLPIIDKPIIQYIVEELVNSGIKDILIVIRGNNYNLSNHFDGSAELETHLEKNKKFDKLEEIQKLTSMANIVYAKQNPSLPYGNGTPLICVKDFLDEGEFFAYVFADDLVLSEKPALLQLIEKYEETGSPIIASQEVKRELVNKYGIVALKDKEKGTISGYVEKPTMENAPSTLAAFGRYILSTDIVKILDKKYLGKDNELWLADAINIMAREKDIYNIKVDGEWLTTGDPLNYIQAMIKYALKRDDLRRPLQEFLKNV